MSLPIFFELTDNKKSSIERHEVRGLWDDIFDIEDAKRISLLVVEQVLKDGIDLKWSRKFGQVAKVYPIDLKGYENGETPEFFGRV